MKDKDYTKCADFLADEKFVLWQLMPCDELDEYWLEFAKQHPHLKDEMDFASTYLKTKGLNNPQFSKSDKVALLNKINSSIASNRRRSKRNTWMLYSVAASVAIAIVIVGFNLFKPDSYSRFLKTDKEMIVGILVNNEDIQLISGDNATTFESDIEMEIDEKGNATITQSKSGNKSDVVITSQSLNKLVVPYGKRTKINLSDGSQVWLNSGSVLEFPAQFGKDERNVYLASGEMYIEVATDKKRKFNVHTSEFKVMVHGTKFNLSAYTDSPQSVVLVEGSVALQSTDKQEVMLSPSEQAVLSTNGKFHRQSVDVNQFVSWKNGFLTFDKTPMTEVLLHIGRYYNLSFDFDQDVNLQKRTCTGKIHLSNNLDNVLTAIGLLTSTKYEKENNQIYIINKQN